MNRVILVGRLTKDPDIRYSQNGGDQMAIATYTLAVDRLKKDAADFIRCKAFGKSAEFAEKYLKKGTNILIEGRIQTGSYEDKNNQKVFTTDVIVDRHEFVESKKAAEEHEDAPRRDDFVPIPEDSQEELPFKF